MHTSLNGNDVLKEFVNKRVSQLTETYLLQLNEQKYEVTKWGKNILFY
jgi:hypothetical protein